MTKPPIARVLARDRARLLDELNYLNLAEIKRFCRRVGIPYGIDLDDGTGRPRRSGEDDRKGVILGRVRTYLETGVVPSPTRFSASVIAKRPLARSLSAGDRLYYGQYDKQNRAMSALLAELTDDRFRHGAVSRMLAREFWSRGVAPTFREFAAAWLDASAAHTRPNPEWAFLSDLADRSAGKEWKTKRDAIARRVLAMLERIT